MKIAYYPGCSLSSMASEYDLSTRCVCEKLDIELKEVPDWNCCGASVAHSLNHFLGVALPFRNLILTQNMKLDTICAPCAACFNRLQTSKLVMEEDENLRKKVEEIMGEKYENKVSVKHLLQILTTEEMLAKIASKVIRPLEGLKIAPYYGCLLVRPEDIVQFDDAENPQSMDKLIIALGGEVVEFSYKVECCGASLTLPREDIVLKLTNDILREAKEAEANCVVVACPLCHSNLDMKQASVETKYEVNYNLPIFYFTELIGIALDVKKERLGWDKHFVNPENLLKETSVLPLK